MTGPVPDRNPTVRLHLLLIALAALLPVWGLAGHVAGRMADAERTRIITAAQSASRDLAFMLERDLLTLQAKLSALGATPGLQEGDLAAFHAHAFVLPLRRKARLRLADAGGLVLADTAFPPGAPGMPPALPAPPRRGISSLQPPDGPGAPQRIDITQPVPQGGGGSPEYFLVASIDPAEMWAGEMEWSRLPQHWSGMVADIGGNVVARTPSQPETAGIVLPEPEAARRALLEGEPLGWTRDRAPDGRAFYVAWHRVDGAPWMVLVGLPGQLVDGALLRLLSPVLLVGGGMLLLFTGALAFWVDRRMAIPLERLGRMAVAFGRGAALPGFPATGLREIDSAAAALAGAAAERDALEAERAALTTRLQTVLESTHDSVLVLDRDGTVLYMNGRARAQLGPGGPSTGRPLRESFPGWESGPFGAACQRATAEGTPQSATAFHPALGRWIAADIYPSAEGLSLFFRDVSDERAAQVALRESEARLKAVLENVSVGMLLAEAPGGRILLGNRRMEEILRRPIPLSAGVESYREDWECYHPDGRRLDGMEFPLGRALLTGLPANGEFQIRRGDGSMVWLRAAAAPVRDARGRVTGAVVALSDIDAERRAAEALRESELRFRTLAEAIPQIVWSTLPDGRIDYVNPRLQDFTGLPPGIAMESLARIVHPRDQGRAERAWQRALRRGEAFSAELRLLRAEGGWRWCVARALPVRASDGTILRWIGAVTDVSELAEAREELARQVAAQTASREAAVRSAAALAASESRFRRFAEASPDVMWMTNAEGTQVEFISPAFEQIWGIPQERLLADHDVWIESIHEADRPRVREERNAAALTGRIDSEYRILRPDGGMRWIRDIGFPILDARGVMTRRGGLARDVTAGKAAEARQILLLGELNHRVKNTLATVHSLALQTARTAGDSPDAMPRFLKDFQARLLTLSRGHDLLTARTWRGATLEDTARAALAPWQAAAESGEERLTVRGPAVWLAPRQTLGLALALHELATNATKHGALTRAEGRVLVLWQGLPDGMVQLRWQERNGPPARSPTRRGFGSRLLERGLPAELGPGSSVTMTYAETGFEAVIRFRPVNGPQVEEETA
ncbi:PAS domain S-box protein [Teichococcus rhizosphaerae]|nr:PAS domain S-box protein [Pseudoroseomonas rhizosphaerae]